MSIYPNSAKIEADLSDLLTAAEVADMFGITLVTLHVWRTTRKHTLPTVNIPGAKRPSIRFYRPDVLAWAAREGEEVYGRVPRLNVVQQHAPLHRVMRRVAREQMAAA